MCGGWGFRIRVSMGTERKRKVSLFDVVDDAAAKMTKSNGGVVANSLVNRWNGKPYSQRYHDILEKRKTLPVWQQKEEFLQVLRDNQTLILVGETGSGKTTQVGFFLRSNAFCCLCFTFCNVTSALGLTSRLFKTLSGREQC